MLNSFGGVGNGSAEVSDIGIPWHGKVFIDQATGNNARLLLPNGTTIQISVPSSNNSVAAVNTVATGGRSQAKTDLCDIAEGARWLPVLVAEHPNLRDLVQIANSSRLFHPDPDGGAFIVDLTDVSTATTIAFNWTIFKLFGHFDPAIDESTWAAMPKASGSASLGRPDVSSLETTLSNTTPGSLLSKSGDKLYRWGSLQTLAGSPKLMGDLYELKMIGTGAKSGTLGSGLSLQITLIHNPVADIREYSETWSVNSFSGSITTFKHHKVACLPVNWNNGIEILYGEWTFNSNVDFTFHCSGETTVYDTQSGSTSTDVEYSVAGIVLATYSTSGDAQAPSGLFGANPSPGFNACPSGSYSHTYSDYDTAGNLQIGAEPSAQVIPYKIGFTNGAGIFFSTHGVENYLQHAVSAGYNYGGVAQMNGDKVVTWDTGAFAVAGGAMTDDVEIKLNPLNPSDYEARNVHSAIQYVDLPDVTGKWYFARWI